VKVVAALALLIAALVPVVAPASAAAPSARGEFFPLAPARILDTRFGTGGIRGPVNADAPFELKVTGTAGVPDTGVLAVALNVTVDAPSDSGYLIAYPSGAPRPDASTLNFLAGQAAPNLTVVGAGIGGAVTFVVTNGVGGRFSGHVIVDVVGWYADETVSTPGSRLYTVTPQRVLDTRRSFGGPGPLGPNGEIELQIAGRFADASGAVVNGLDAVVLNLTVNGATSTSFATVYPADQGRPDVSNTNVQVGKDKAALVMVKVPANGRVRIYNARGSVQFIADVVGFYRSGADPDTFAGRVVPLSAPFRAVDTRADNIRLGTGQAETWAFDDFLGSATMKPYCPCGGLLMNLTGTDATAPTFLTMFPGEPRPDASTENFTSGEAVANLSVAKLAPGTGPDGNPYQSTLRFYNAGGFTNYLGDVTAIIQSD
jgi:hypothetical protein